MQRTIIIILVFTVLVAVFALQNSAEVVIKLWFWSKETSLALVVILAFAVGALMGILFSIPSRKRKKEPDASMPEEIPLEVNIPSDPNEEDDPEFEDLIR